MDSRKRDFIAGYIAGSRLSFDIPDEASGGNCFETAVHNCIVDQSLLICHGIVCGQGELSGVEYPHAWNERGDMVIDTSNGNDVCMQRDLYYEIGNIHDVHRYTYRDAMEIIVVDGTYGPWEPSLLFDYRMT